MGRCGEGIVSEGVGLPGKHVPVPPEMEKEAILEPITESRKSQYAFVLNAAGRPGVLSLLLALVALCALTVPLRAADNDDLYRELLRRSEVINAELENILYEIDNPRPVPDMPERVLSLRKNAAVSIGGEMRANYIHGSGSGEDPSFTPGLANKGKTKHDLSGMRVTTARLMIDARAHDRWRLFLDLSLHGYNGRHKMMRTENPNAGLPPSQWTSEYQRDHDDLLVSQAYVEMMKASHSGFGFIVGKVRLPFGLWNEPNLMTQSYMDGGDLSASYLMQPNGWNNGVRLPHASRFVDPPLAAMLTYEMRDIVRFEAAMFQETDRTWARHGNGGVRDESGALFRSWQVGLSLQPLENWELTAHYRNRHSRRRNMTYWSDSPYRWDFRGDMASGDMDPRWDGVLGQWSDTGTGESFGSTENEQAVVVGLAVEIPNTNLRASVEYAHGYNQGFNKYIASDDVNVALAYQATPRLTLHVQGEWLHVRDRSWMVETAGSWQRDRRDNNLYRFLIGAEYELASGLTAEAGWQYEHWRVRSKHGVGQDGGDRTNRANVFYLGTRFIF